jgi:regulator of cell morphogenesis and NO signaling
LGVDGLGRLVDHLEATHHRYLWTELPRLSALVSKVVRVHGERHPELRAVRRRFEVLRAELEPHLATEERVLFPIIRQVVTSSASAALRRGSLGHPILVMLAEHDRAGELLAGLRRLTDGFQPPADGCASYRACYAALADLEADIHLHVHKENNVLFPAIVRLQEQRPGVLL